MLPEIARELLVRMAEETPSDRVQVGVGADGPFTYTWSSNDTAAQTNADPVAQPSSVSTT
jgi:hypothetical protein